MKAVFFDLDDTLYDSRPIYEQGLRRAWACFNSEAADGKNHPLLEWKEFEAAYVKARAEVKNLIPWSTSVHSRLLYFKRLAEAHAGGNRPALALQLDASYCVAWDMIPA